MNKILNFLVVLSAGITIGWYGHVLWQELNEYDRQQLISAFDISQVIESEPIQVPSPQTPYWQALQDALLAKDNQLIITSYHALVQSNPVMQQDADILLREYFQGELDAKRFVYLIPLLENLLQIYPQDITTWNILIESYLQSADIRQAIFTLYKLESNLDDYEDIEKVKSRIKLLVQAYDQQLLEDNQVTQLLKFYEELSFIDESNYSYLFRRAELFAQLKDYTQALSLLDYLQSDLKWGAAAKRLKDIILEKMRAKEGILLTRHGEHFIVPVELNGQYKLNLLIDTGASLSVISRGFFQNVIGNNVAHYQSQVRMNTANGQVIAPVYRFKNISIAGRKVNDIDVAVVDMPESSVYQGLLGMNFLKFFQFEMNQEQSLLFLDPKH
ncbi:retropepsin-like aspartic protease [Zooshikella harenae]|uniref:Clan AA aspartic protease n=1 Tax=Zooshikella harenae TaxID=2827238 RepID=A0ABS5ZC65_9GAMM|nr:retropepsin-like aspartic protease [Zooshikella harenae]MBU2710850.1 clan AA aspartic protease [Zooshikella harenae]